MSTADFLPSPTGLTTFSSKLTPLGRTGTSQDIRRAVYFFASELADFVSGQTLYVDGGLFAKPHWPYGV